MFLLYIDVYCVDKVDKKFFFSILRNFEMLEMKMDNNTLRLGAQSSYVVKYFEGSNAVKTTTSMGN